MRALLLDCPPHGTAARACLSRGSADPVHTRTPRMRQAMSQTTSPPRWQFWIDRGGTFPDIVARRPDGSIATHKLLSDNPEHYRDAALAGMRHVLGIASHAPIPWRCVEEVDRKLKGVRLVFRKSNGGVTKARRFQGKDAILSGPAGGIVGAVRTSLAAGFGRIIGFDMGGTSTDVSHYAGEFEREFETRVAGVRMRAPMMSIHTVAAGGGSILHFDGARYRVGPDSAGANPGPACYRRGR